MAKFKDSTGHEWTPLFNVTLAREIRQTCEIDLLTLVGKGPAFARMETDRDLLARVLWVTCCDEADRLGIDEAAFCSRLAGEVFNDALKAARAAVLDFQAFKEEQPAPAPKRQPPGNPPQQFISGPMQAEFSTHPEEQGGNVR